ncbi:hypothetical protein F5887DRAFT_827391, partial [Amanita rubescens]
ARARPPRAPLSKEHLAVLRASRQIASGKYQEAIREACALIEEKIAAIAQAHGKRVRRVRGDVHMGAQVSLRRHSRRSGWNAFMWMEAKKDKENRVENGIAGKEVLPDLIKRKREQYAELTKEEREALIEQLEMAKATQAKGFQPSARSRVNDVTKTLRVLENEIANLRSRTGIEALLFMTRGASPSTAINGISYATPGVEKFLEAALKIDEHEFIAKMEGFALQALKGITSNYKQEVSTHRGAIRAEINNQLRIITGDENAQMEWKHYWRKVVARHKVMIKGWPDNIPFKNLSEASSALHELKSLLEQWQDGRICWKILTDEEAEHLFEEHSAQGEVPEATRRVRSDRGKKRKR